jgi:hypothetical protein
MADAKKSAKKKPHVAFKDMKARKGPKAGLNPQPLPPLKIKLY